MQRLFACALVLVLTSVPTFADVPPTTKSDELVRLSKRALTQEARGERVQAQRTFERILLIDADHALARRALGYVRVGSQWVKAGDAHRAASPDVPRVVEKTPRALHRALRHAPRARDRAQAAEALAAHGDRMTIRRLREAAIRDRVESVRGAAVDALTSLDRRRATHHFGDLLQASSRETRIRAAEALARIGDELAASYVVYRWESVGGRSPRAYFATARQRSYIQDFDVEVAATSFIADPIVGVVQEGSLLDASVLSTYRSITTVERVAYVGALERISGHKLGSDVRAWRRWLTDLRARNRAARDDSK